MAQTPYQDLGSTNILSAYVTGLQHSVNNIESVLDMETRSVAGHTLNPVTDQDDPSFRYRIYEGTIRNWMDYPVPTVYRNGSEVDASEYDMSPAYGVVVFHEQQAPNDEITADFEHVTDSSQRITDIESSIGGSTGGSSGTRMFLASGLWASHNRDGFAELSPNTALAGSLIDAFPFPVGYPMTLDAIAVRVDTAAGNNGAMAIYKDNGGYPGGLVIDAGSFDTSTTGWKINAIDITLNPGMYWLVRNQDGACALAGFKYEDVIPVGIDINSIPTESGVKDGSADMRNAGFFGGLRGGSSAGLNGFPQTFPSGISPFSRAYYCSVFVRAA